ncbi:MAG: hypothetical protein IJU73_02010 [Ruminococcus sp.]|nr:hypothetical protein [Ruminococcus sp.]
MIIYKIQVLFLAFMTKPILQVFFPAKPYKPDKPQKLPLYRDSFSL